MEGQRDNAESTAIAIGSPHPFPWGRVTCECGWGYELTEQDTVESVQPVIDAHIHIDGDPCPECGEVGLHGCLGRRAEHDDGDKDAG